MIPTQLVVPDPTMPVPVSTPAIKIETETLRDAEETDYHLMETLIERRYVRGSRTKFPFSYSIGHEIESRLLKKKSLWVWDVSCPSTGYWTYS